MIVGLDMGGTHIDGVIIQNGEVIQRVKKARNNKNLLQSIWITLKELLDGHDKLAIQRINLSTTVSTNAIIEDKIASVGMFIESGPGIKNNFRYAIDELIFLSGYMDHRGKEVDPIDYTEIKKGISLFKEKELEAYGVVGKFSVRNPNHELAVKKLLEAEQMNAITLGHRMSGKLNFPRRVFTTYLNAAVSKKFQEFANHIEKSLAKEKIYAPVSILKADGGTMSMKMAVERPVETILSGPAASFTGLNAMLPTEKDAVFLDIGGTTTDIFFLADGVPLFEPVGIKIDKYKTLVRSIYSVSIGLGGDSEVKIVGGELKIGPRRLGHPLAFGGPAVTPTDAMVFLGLINDGSLSRAEKGIANIAKKLGKTLEYTAKKILNKMAKMIRHKIDEQLKEINSQPVYTIKELLDNKKIELQLINVIGGPAKVLSAILEKEMKLKVNYPKNYQVANALGAALAKTTTEITMLVDTNRNSLSVAELGIYEKVSSNYDLEDAKKYSLELLKKSALKMGADLENLELEIIEADSFNMIDGFYKKGKNIRVKAQVKPGLIRSLKGDGKSESK